MSMEIRIKQNSVMTILPIHFRFGPMYTYFNDVLPERRVTATLVVCVNASIFTRQLLPSYILIIFLFRFSALCLFVACVTGYSSFQDSIPNGKNVPHPCIVDSMWNGVGHENPGGGGSRNPFGIAFHDNGYVSTCNQINMQK